MHGPEATSTERRIKRPVVSEIDGTREGALVFCIALMGGTIAATLVLPGALTSFWVWAALLSVSIGLALSVQSMLAAIYGFEGEVENDG